MDNGHWPYDSSPQPRDHHDGWVVAGDDQAGRTPRHQGGYGSPEGYDATTGYGAGSGYNATNGSRHAGAVPGDQYPPVPGGRYNGAHNGSWQRAEQPLPTGRGHAEPSYQPRHVGRASVRGNPPPTSPIRSTYPPAATETVRARRVVTASASAPVRPAAPAEAPADPGRSRLSAVLWTLGFYVVPVVVYLIWAVTLSGDPPAGCVGADGGPCPPPRTAAFTNFTESALALAGALLASLVISLGLARLASDWRGFTVGFAASVIGAGGVTLFVSAIG